MRALAATLVFASAAAGAAIVSGCDAFDASGDTPAPPAEAGAPADSGSNSAPDSGGGGGGGDAGGDAGCTTVERVFDVSKDTGWASNGCAMANSFGDFEYLNFDMVAMTFREPSDTGIDLATVTAMRLELAADPNCSGCAGGLPTKAGNVSIHPMRIDWVERVAVGGTYAGADACRRTDGNPGKGWGPDRPAGGGTMIASPVDFDGLAGTLTLNNNDVAVKATLDPAAFKARFGGRTVIEIGVLLIRDSNGRIVIASKESKTLPKPRLILTTCVPK